MPSSEYCVRTRCIAPVVNVASWRAKTARTSPSSVGVIVASGRLSSTCAPLPAFVRAQECIVYPYNSTFSRTINTFRSPSKEPPKLGSAHRRNQQPLTGLHLRGVQVVGKLDLGDGLVDRQARQLGGGHLGEGLAGENRCGVVDLGTCCAD